jgi:hypothetical protein
MKAAGTSGLWVVDFSRQRRVFDVHQLSDSTRFNLEMYRKDQPPDRVIVAIAPSRDEATAILEVLDSRADRSAPFGDEDNALILEQLREMGALDFLAET